MLTLAGITFFLKRVAFFIWDNKVAVLIVIAMFAIAGFFYRACSKPQKFDEATIEKARQAIAKQDRQQMTEVLVESEVAERQIDANLANAENEKLKTVAEARKKASGLSNEELAAEIERRLNE